MAEPKKGDKADQPSEEEVAATSQQYAGTAGGEAPTPRQLVEQATATTQARNPKDWGAEVKVDDLPPVPTSGMFMSAEEATEDLAPAGEPAEQRRGSAEKKP